MLCKGHIIITYHNTSLFIFPESSDACGQWLPILHFTLSFSLSPSSGLSLLSARQKKSWMVYLCLCCMFGHLSSISGVWKTCFVVIAISLQCNLPCDWVHTLFHTLSAGCLPGMEFPSQTLFKKSKRMLPFLIANNYREVLKTIFFFLSVVRFTNAFFLLYTTLQM